MSTETREYFATAFDLPVPALEPPAEVTSGRDPVVRMVDGFFPGVGIVGRFSTSSGLLALKVATDGQPIRVDVLVRLDRTSERWWRQRVPADVQQDGHPTTRLLTLRSQGSTRAAAVLATRAHLSRKPVRAVLRFELGPDEVVDDGLLLLDFHDVPRSSPGWGNHFSPYSPVGVAIVRIEVTPTPPRSPRRRPLPALDAATCERLGVLSTGDLPEIDASGEQPLGATSFVVNPPPAHLWPDSSGWMLVGVRAELEGRVLSHLPNPAALALTEGVIGQAVTRARATVERVKPLRVAVARQLRAELNLKKLAGAIERRAGAQSAHAESLLTALQSAGALRAAAIRLSDQTQEPVAWVTSAEGATKLRLPASGGPLLVQLGVDKTKAAAVLRGRRIRWSVSDLRATTEDVFVALAGRVAPQP